MGAGAREGGVGQEDGAMSEYDELLESVLEERDVPLVERASGALLFPASRSLSTGSGEVPINQTSDGPAASPDVPARRGMARQRERSGRCPMYAPAGTKCKTCGKVHPL